MIASILWKEYREQRAVWLVMVGLAATLLVGLPMIFPADFDHRPDDGNPLAVVGLVLTWAYGMVCAAMLLAGEREAKTQPFLDALPGSRGRLWVAKCGAGMLFVATFALVVAVIVATTSLLDRPEWFVGALVLAAAGCAGFGWGLYTSAFARTALGAIGLAIALQFLFYLVAVVVGSGLFALLVYLIFPLPFSAFVYGGVDRRRRIAEVTSTAFLGDFRRRMASMLWLAYRQIRSLAIWLLPLGLVLGLLCIPQPLVLWPAFTLGLGTICGVSCFLDEQAGPRRFLGDQRFPLGTVWGVKVGLRLALLASTLFVALLPLLVRFYVEIETQRQAPESDVTFAGKLFRSGLVSLTVSPGVLLFAPALTGFAVGLLSGLVFRKAFIAAMAGAVLALVAFGVWVPGLLSGGVPSWQVFLVPLILLVAARLTMRPWASERLLSRRVILSMTGLVVGCALLLGLGLWYRVASIPEMPDPKELGELLARLRESDRVETGQLVRSALSTFRTQSKVWDKEKPSGRLVPRKEPAGVAVPSFGMQLSEVIARGWPAPGKAERELAGWLDRVFADDVWKRFDRLPSLPVGVVVDPRRVDYNSYLTDIHPATRVGDLLAARGLQMQQRGDPEVFVKHLEVAFALARNLDNDSPPGVVHMRRWLESVMTRALEHWLASLTGRPDLLRRVGDALDRQGSVGEGTERVRDMAEYLVARNTLDDPANSFLWHGQREPAAAIVPEHHLVALAWQLPWEYERQVRLLRRHFFADIPVKADSPMLPVWPRHEAGRIQRERERGIYLGIARLRVALRLYQATTGKPATDLKQLVPAMIASIPLDPYDGQPFRYRLSAGEKIEGMPVPNEDGTPIATTREIPAGQGILWSIGPDGRDDGGKVFGTQSGDLIFLVPLGKNKEKG